VAAVADRILLPVYRLASSGIARCAATLGGARAAENATPSNAQNKKK